MKKNTQSQEKFTFRSCPSVSFARSLAKTIARYSIFAYGQCVRFGEPKRARRTPALEDVRSCVVQPAGFRTNVKHADLQGPTG